MVDIVYAQPLKELLQVSTYFNEPLIILVNNETQELAAKKASLTPCYVVSEETKNLQSLSSKKKAVIGGSVAANEFAVRIKADYLLQPSNQKQFFDLALAQKLTDNGTTTVLMLEELISANSFERQNFWKSYISVVDYCKRKKTKFMVASGCKDPLLMRPRKVRVAVAVTLGLSQELAEKYLE